MNYDLYFAEMALITKDGDTTQLNRTKELKLISIGDHLFLHDYKVGYVEIIQQLPVSLGVLNVMNTLHMEYVSGNRDGIFYGYDMRGTSISLRPILQEGKTFLFRRQGQQSLQSHSCRYSQTIPQKQRRDRCISAAKTEIDFENGNDLVKLLLFCHAQSHENQN